MAWYEGLLRDDAGTAERVTAALELLEQLGPSLGPFSGGAVREVVRVWVRPVTRLRDHGGGRVARTWQELRLEAVADGRLDGPRVAAAKARQLAQVRAHRQVELREALGMTQVAVAVRLRVSQPRLSRIERGVIDHTQLETPRAYLEALGGELEVSARFGDERILIVG